MADTALTYRHNTSPHRGLAASGIVLLKLLLVVPHTIVVSALQCVSVLLAYIGYWAVLVTGRMPQAIHRLIEITIGWTARMWGWVSGITDIYPPFETYPEYPVSFEVLPPEKPNRWWALSGVTLVKLAVAIPHLVTMAFLGVGAMVAVWFGYFIVLATGEYSTGLQDFAAGVLQWNLRVASWLAGTSDTYPPFNLEASPTA